jgi:hypothetical protein
VQRYKTAATPWPPTSWPVPELAPLMVMLAVLPRPHP